MALPAVADAHWHGWGFGRGFGVAPAYCAPYNYGGYYAPASSYYGPAVSVPAPVYVAPAPVYAGPPVIYDSPSVVYDAPYYGGVYLGLGGRYHGYYPHHYYYRHR
jgi:hypothetical protein